jgi:hypothetical protein
MGKIAGTETKKRAEVDTENLAAEKAAAEAAAVNGAVPVQGQLAPTDGQNVAVPTP